MINKINVQIIVPFINKKYDLLIPANKIVGEVIFILLKGLNILNNNMLENNNNFNLYSTIDGKAYALDEIIYNTDIRNGSILILC